MTFNITGHPLHPLSFQLSKQKPGDKEQLVKEWCRASQSVQHPLPSEFQSEIPFIASDALQTALDARCAFLCKWLTPHVKAKIIQDRGFPRGRDADVLTIDFAIVRAPSSTLGWELRLVEFQAFASILATGYLMHQAFSAYWPELAGLTAWQTPPENATWLEATKDWLNPKQDAFLLDHSILHQKTSFDLLAAARMWNLPLIEPNQLILQSNGRFESIPGIPIERLFNRLITHDLPDPAAFSSLIKHAEVTWHSHPEWYFLVHKGLMAHIPFGPDEKCTTGENWKNLGHAPADLVAKHMYSFAGTAVHLNLTEHDLASLQNPQDWLIQPKYAPLPLTLASDGAPLFAEIRLMVSLKNHDIPWTAMQLCRVHRGAMASASSIQKRPGEGISLLFRPPA
jgi:hypothetical protein